MKVLVGHFHTESNEHSYQNMGFDNFMFKYGEESIDVINMRDIFEKRNKNCTEYICECSS